MMSVDFLNRFIFDFLIKTFNINFVCESQYILKESLKDFLLDTIKNLQSSRPQ